MWRSLTSSRIWRAGRNQPMEVPMLRMLTLPRGGMFHRDLSVDTPAFQGASSSFALLGLLCFDCFPFRRLRGGVSRGWSLRPQPRHNPHEIHSRDTSNCLFNGVWILSCSVLPYSYEKRESKNGGENPSNTMNSGGQRQPVIKLILHLITPLTASNDRNRLQSVE